MKSNLIDIACEIVSDDPSKGAIAVIDGTMEELAGGHKRQKWFWLPRTQIEVEENGRSAIVTMPVWLAEEKGLV